ncbi:TauD/TfdA family dioxygenase [Nitriliruptoraceae bacterium ZYF776]|nr:TauD/TfdA family dioxygenase [Profundirhabdus halotolerans]
MTTLTSLEPVSGPAAWRGDELARSTDWIYELSQGEIEELERLGRRFVADDPDLRSVVADDYPFDVARSVVEHAAQALDAGHGFLLVRGLPTEGYDDALAGAIFYLVGLHLGEPMRQNERGDLIDHIRATSNKTRSLDPNALGSKIRDALQFHSDSSDVVALMCLRAAKEGGASSLVSGGYLYNEVLARRPDLAPLLFEPFHFDWYKQDHAAPANTYTSPIVSLVDGVFSMYAGTPMILSAQDYPEVPRLTDAQREVLALIDEIIPEPGVVLDMDFRPGDMQWLLNYAALHSRTEFVDHPEPERRRHLLRLWLHRDVNRPLAPEFGRHVVVGRDAGRDGREAADGRFTIRAATATPPDEAA